MNINYSVFECPHEPCDVKLELNGKAGTDFPYLEYCPCCGRSVQDTATSAETVAVH